MTGSTNEQSGSNVSHSQVIGRFVRRVLKRPGRTFLLLVLAPALAVGTLTITPAKAYAAVPEVRTALPQGRTLPSTAVAFGSAIVWDTLRSSDTGATWHADGTLSGNYRWDFAGGGKMARAIETTTTTAVVYTPSTGTTQNYDAIPSGYNALNATYASYDTSIYNMVTKTSTPITAPTGATSVGTRQVLGSSNALLWVGSSTPNNFDLFAVATSPEPNPAASAGAWVQIPNVMDYQVTDTDFLYAVGGPTSVSLCRRALSSFAVSSCIVVASRSFANGFVTVTSMGAFTLVQVQDYTSAVPVDQAYVVSSSLTTVSPVDLPDGSTVYRPFLGGSPYVVVLDVNTVPTVNVLSADGSLTPSFAIPATKTISPEYLAVAPDRVVGADARDGSRSVPVWSRTVSASGFGAETALPTRASGLAASAGRTAVMGPAGVSVYDRGGLQHTFADQAQLGFVELSGPYVAEYLQDASSTTTTKISKADGTFVQQFPGWSGVVFGSQYVSTSVDALPTGSMHVVVHDLTGVAANASITLAAGTAGCYSAGVWGSSIVLYCAEGSRIYNDKTGDLLATTPDGVESLGDGYAVVNTGAATTYAVWNLSTNAMTPIGCSSIQTVMASDGAGHVVCSTSTQLFWQDYSSLAKSAPRLLGVIAPSSVSFADPSTRWTPQIDTTKALKPGKIVISANDGTVVRGIPTTASSDGSIRGFGWDGRDSYGQGVPAGVYTYTVQVDGADGSGTTVSVDGSGPATGTVTVAAAAASFSPGALVSLSPSRLLDTRITGPRLGANTTRSLQVTGAPGIPKTGVAAVVLNVTVTETTSGGYLTVSPTGSTRPLVSNLNWSAGATIPNAVTVKVGTGGKIDLYQSGPGTAQVIVDIAGYFTSGTVADPGGFTSITPARLLDTRTAGGGGKIPANTTRDLPILGQGGVPATNVSAVVLNTTVTETTAGGYLTVFPSGTTKPVASNLNWSAGATIPNLVTVKVGDNGKVSLYQSGPGTAQVIVDVAGYYLGGTATKPGMFVALSPVRVLDTRPTPVGGGSDYSLLLLNKGGIPASAVSAVVINVTVTETKAPGYLTVYPGSNPLPTASNLNWGGAGATIPNLVTVPIGPDGAITFHNGSGGTTQVIADTAGYYIGT